MQRLPATYRAPLVLHYLEGKTCEETAAELGTTLGAVRGRLQRGKRELKLRLMKRGVELSAVMAAITMWQSVAVASVQPPLAVSAVQGGMAMIQGTPFAPACSPEAVHLATKETAMFTTGKLFVSSVVLLSTAALGWFAHAEVGGSEISQAAVTPSLTTVASGETVTLHLDEALALAGAGQKEAANETSTAKPQLILKFDDGKPDGKKSIAGTGEMIQFTLPDKSQKLRSIRVHCARYGTAKPPDEEAEVSIVSDDGTNVIHTEFVSYANFKRGESRWTTVRFEEEIEVPEAFWVILQFNAERTKGVYVSYDTSSGGKSSKIGVPGGEPRDGDSNRRDFKMLSPLRGSWSAGLNSLG